MMMSEVYWFDCSQRMPEIDRMVLVYGSAIGGTRYAGYERSLNEWVLDDMETVSARDVTMWANCQFLRRLTAPRMDSIGPGGTQRA